MTIANMVTRIRMDERTQLAIARYAQHPEQLETIAGELGAVILDETCPEADEELQELYRDVCAVALAATRSYTACVSALHDVVVPPEPPRLPHAGLLTLEAGSKAGMLQSLGWYQGHAGLRVVSHAHDGLFACATWPCQLDAALPEAELADWAARALVCAARLIPLPS